jgi:hypothetical protein
MGSVARRLLGALKTEFSDRKSDTQGYIWAALSQKCKIRYLVQLGAAVSKPRGMKR